MSDGGADAASAPSGTDRRDGVEPPTLRTWRVAGYALAALLALVPVVRMALLVREAAPLQYNDYWLLLPHYTNPDGSLNVGGLFDFEFQNHPVVLPMLAYWLNIQLFAGSNVALGAFVLALSIGLLAAIGMILVRTGFRPVERMAVLVLASCLLFTPNGAWNYALGMSGTAWLGADLVAVVAIYLRSRDKHLLAFGSGFLAAITYGTGLVVWPAMAAVGACRRPLREWWREWPYLMGFVANYLWYRQVQTTGLGANVDLPGPVEAVRQVSRLLALPLGLRDSAAQHVGLVILLGLAALVVWFAVVARSAAAPVWVGIAAFGLLATANVAIGRHAFLVVYGNEHRYASLPSLALIGFGALLVLAFRHLGERQIGRGRGALSQATPWVPLVVLAALAVPAATTGGAHVEAMRDQVPEQELREIALHLDIADGTPYLASYPVEVTDLLKGLDHQPFVDGWDLDCGLLDERLPTPDRADPAGAIVSHERLGTLDGAVQITGTVASSRAIRCVVVADEADQVVGAGTVKLDDVPGTGGDSEATGFRAIARPGSVAYRAFVIFEDDPTPKLIGAVTPDAE